MWNDNKGRKFEVRGGGGKVTKLYLTENTGTFKVVDNSQISSQLHHPLAEPISIEAELHKLLAWLVQ